MDIAYLVHIHTYVFYLQILTNACNLNNLFGICISAEPTHVNYASYYIASKYDLNMTMGQSDSDHRHSMYDWFEGIVCQGCKSSSGFDTFEYSVFFFHCLEIL